MCLIREKVAFTDDLLPLFFRYDGKDPNFDFTKEIHENITKLFSSGSSIEEEEEEEEVHNGRIVWAQI